MFACTFGSLIYNSEVEKKGGDIFYLIVSIGRVIHFTWSFNDPAFFRLRNLNRLGNEVIFINFHDFNTRCGSGIKAFKKSLPHFTSLCTRVPSVRSGIKSKSHASDCRGDKKDCFTVFVHDNQIKKL